MDKQDKKKNMIIKSQHQTDASVLGVSQTSPSPGKDQASTTWPWFYVWEVLSLLSPPSTSNNMVHILLFWPPSASALLGLQTPTPNLAQQSWFETRLVGSQSCLISHSEPHMGLQRVCHEPRGPSLDSTLCCMMITSEMSDTQRPEMPEDRLECEFQGRVRPFLPADSSSLN